MALSNQIQQPRLRKMYAWWLAHCHGDRFPSRADVDLDDLTFMHGNFMIIEVSREPLRFTFGRVGPDLVQLMGRDWTGEPVDSYEPPEFRDQLIGVYRDVVQSRQPVANSRRLLVDDQYLRYDGIILPLSRDGFAIDALLVGIVPLGDWGFAAAKRR